ncbi:MAG: hypothetical protein LBS57_00285, partial [Treponema sp.]|nr:hypothetical protein [Treponema sp.]
LGLKAEFGPGVPVGVGIGAVQPETEQVLFGIHAVGGDVRPTAFFETLGKRPRPNVFRRVSKLEEKIKRIC